MFATLHTEPLPQFSRVRAGGRDGYSALRVSYTKLREGLIRKQGGLEHQASSKRGISVLENKEQHLTSSADTPLLLDIARMPLP
jgi:hypothetical protein